MLTLTGKKSNARQRRKNLDAFLFCLPAILLGIVFLIVPIIMSFVYSFTDFYMLAPQKTEFVGFQNYIDLFSDTIFWQAVKNTLYYVAVTVPVQCILALMLALMVHKKRKLVGVYRLMYFAPVITSATVVTILFKLFYSETDGIFNLILEIMSLPRQGFLNDPKQAMLCLILMSVWQGVGYQMIIIVAGLQEINPTLYEAASIDGAGRWRQFWSITVPSLAPVLIFIAVTTFTGACKMFTQAYIMTSGGPLNSTKTIVYYIYECGIVDRQVGYGSAISVVFTVVFIIASAIVGLILKKRRDKEA